MRGTVRPWREGHGSCRRADLTGANLSEAIRVTMILNRQRGVSADSALRLARYFGTTPQLWLNLQKTWELRRAEIAAGDEIAARVTPIPSAACEKTCARTFARSLYQRYREGRLSR